MLNNDSVLNEYSQEYIIEKESVELPYIPVEYVFGESRAWNAIRKIKLTNEHARASRVNDQMSRYSPETYSL